MSNMPLWERYIGSPLLRIHDTIYQKTNGRIGHRIPGAAAEPAAAHRRRQDRRSSAPTSLSYAEDGGDYLVVASKGGDPKAPGWYHNLKANPKVEINVGPKAVRPSPRGSSAPTTRTTRRLWKMVNDNNSNRYDGYQKRTTRPIPIVALTPLEQLLGEQFQRLSRAGAVAGSVPRWADATGLTITSSTSKCSASARTWSAASVGIADDGAAQPDVDDRLLLRGQLDAPAASSTRSSGPQRLAGAQPRHHLQVRQQQRHLPRRGCGATEALTVRNVTGSAARSLGRNSER